MASVTRCRPWVSIVSLRCSAAHPSVFPFQVTRMRRKKRHETRIKSAFTSTSSRPLILSFLFLCPFAFSLFLLGKTSKSRLPLSPSFFLLYPSLYLRILPSLILPSSLSPVVLIIVTMRHDTTSIQPIGQVYDTDFQGNVSNPPVLLRSTLLSYP